MFYVVNKYGFKKAKVFFEVDESFNPKKFQIIDYYNMRKISDNGLTVSSLKLKTLISDVSRTDEEILKDFSSNTKYKVKRAIREGAISEFYFSKNENFDIFDALISEVDKNLIEMYQLKGISHASIKELLFEYYNNQILGISVASIASKRVAYHVYIMCNGMVRLAYSVSNFRNSTEKNKIGMVNRMLHFDDMRAVRDLGFNIYDWGGAGESDDVSDITKFKKGFGGIEAPYEHRMVIKKNLIGYLYLFKNKILRR